MYVPVRPEPSAKAGECFWNVKAKADRDGGAILLGRVIWEWPGVLLDAEAHAVWLSPAGDRVDVTPKPDGETKILFVEDPCVAFPRERGELACDNFRKPLTDDPLVHRLIEVCEALVRLQGGRVSRSLSEAQAAEAQRLHQERAVLTWKLSGGERNDPIVHPPSQRIGRNEPCPCGSGKKFKRCCG